MKKTIRLTESDLMRLVKKVIRESEEEVYDYDEYSNSPKENFEIGDEVFIPGYEFYATILDINNDVVTCETPIGKQKFLMDELESTRRDDDLPMFRDMNESRKKTIRLTERDLTRIVNKIFTKF